jgi:hypothetical protein
MKPLFVSIAFAVGVLFGVSAWAQAPAGAIAQCKDGTYFTGTSHKGACKGHQGVKDWLDKDSGTAASDTSTTSKKSKKSSASDTTAAPASTAAPAAAAAPAATAAPAKKTSTASTPTPASEIQQKPGGGAGKVWVNTSSKTYHCQGDEWYGKTKEGSYMTEAAAKAAGNHASHGKECGS